MNTAYKQCKSVILTALSIASVILLSASANATSGSSNSAATGDIEGTIAINNLPSRCQLSGSLVYIPGLSHFAKLDSDGKFKFVDVRRSTTPYTLRVEVVGAQSTLNKPVTLNTRFVSVDIDANPVCPPQEIDCNDNNACTFDSVSGESCSNLQISCDDNNPNTLDSCDRSRGCQHVPVVDNCLIGTVQACYSGPAGTNGVGMCQAGTQTCLGGGKFSVCSGETLPKAETCGDGLDNDCDGTVDEACPAP